MARQSLGRGLSALIGEDTTQASALAVSPFEIDIDLIDTNPQQPRERFNDTELDQLAASIKANGVVQPIVVRRNGNRYQIVAGERRWRATQRAGLRKIPAVVKDVPDEKLLELALIENIQRQELNPIEEANAYRRLIDNIGITQENLSERVGKERTVITTSLRLLKLPNDIQRLVADGRLSAGHGRALLMCDDPKIQRAVANEVVDLGLSVRETERVIKRKAKPVQTIENKALVDSKDANVKMAETRLMRRLGTSVKISPSKKGAGGKIEIEYYGIEDLDRIYQLVMKERSL